MPRKKPLYNPQTGIGEKNRPFVWMIRFILIIIFILTVVIPNMFKR